MDRATGPPAEAIAVPHQALVHNHPRTPRTTGRPPALSQAEEIGAAPAHLRRDRARAEPAESFGAGRASICRAVRRWAARPVEVLAGLVPAADDPDQARALVVDGAPVPCWDRKHEPGPHSGGHHRAGPDLQVACTPAGRPVRVPGPAPGIAPRRESPSTDRSPRQSPGHAATGFLLPGAGGFRRVLVPGGPGRDRAHPGGPPAGRPFLHHPLRPLGPLDRLCDDARIDATEACRTTSAFIPASTRLPERFLHPTRTTVSSGATPTCMLQSYPKQHRKSTKNTVSFHAGQNFHTDSPKNLVKRTLSF